MLFTRSHDKRSNASEKPSVNAIKIDAGFMVFATLDDQRVKVIEVVEHQGEDVADSDASRAVTVESQGVTSVADQEECVIEQCTEISSSGTAVDMFGEDGMIELKITEIK